MENLQKHMKRCISCHSPFMCRHIQPKKEPKNPKLDSSPRPARRRCARRRASRGLEFNIGLKRASGPVLSTVIFPDGGSVIYF